MFGLPTSAIAGAALLGAALVFAVGYTTGHGHATDAADAERLAAVQRTIAQHDQIERENMAIAMTESQAQEQIRTVFREIDREVIRYVQTHADRADCALPDDGLRLIRCALAGPDCPSGPGAIGPVPGPAAVAVRGDLGTPAGNGGTGADLLGVQDAAPGPGGHGAQHGGPG